MKLCDELEGWDKGVGSGKEAQEGASWLIHAVVQQKPIQYFKATIFQLKIKFFFKRKKLYSLRRDRNTCKTQAYEKTET